MIPENSSETSNNAGRLLSIVAVGLLLIVAVGVGVILLGDRAQPATFIISSPAPAPLPTITLTPAPLNVYVHGAVIAAGVYQFSRGDLVQDAIRAAGGFTADADTRHVNLAQSLVDGMQIYVPLVAEGLPEPPVFSTPAVAPAPGRTSGGVTIAGLININTAGVEELELLPGIGPALAQRIIDYRAENGPFASPEDIQDVAGIGPATYADIEAMITVSDAP